MAMTGNTLGAINFVAMLLSIPVLAAGIWLSTLPAEACVNLLQWPLIALGILLLLVSLAGFVGAFWRLPWLLYLYLAAMLALILLLAALVVFVYAVTNAGSGQHAPSRAYLEYRLEDYPGWLRRRVQSSRKWDRIRGCLASTSTCLQMNQTYRMAQDFFYAPITPLQSGCCKPPTQCGYTFVSATYWISPISPGADMDCIQWSNDQKQLCYSCSSCKAGLLANLKKDWRRADLILLVTLFVLIFVYLILLVTLFVLIFVYLMGCYAFRVAKTEQLFRKYKLGYT
uniref:Tetraspanin-31 n=1 Tax=Anthurium amnicola TaxID=1678845 RepID=A0A1D1XPF4_9ARAE